MTNPYEPGTDEYLDYATSQHDEAMKPKPKMKKKKKAMPKMNQKQKGLAESFSDETNRRSMFSGGSAGALYDQLTKSGPRIKR